MTTLEQLLSGNPYPGRGIALGLTPDGKRAAAVYFIMGRSRNSRNRVFAATGDGIRTEAFDESLVEDPSLIIYRAVRCLSQDDMAAQPAAGETGAQYTIVTNGDQTDTIYEGLQRGESFEEALASRTFEPDAPNYTPRISGILIKNGSSGEAGETACDTECAAAAALSYKLAVLKTLGGDPAHESRQFFTYSPARPGSGHFISTYVTDGNPLPSFVGEPHEIAIPDDVETWADTIWQALDADNRVSLYVRAEELTGDGVWECIINANESI